MSSSAERAAVGIGQWTWCITASRLVVVFLAALVHAPAPALAQGQTLDVTLKASEAPGASSAETVILYATSKALVIGIDAYSDKGWPKLSNGIRDAEEVSRALKVLGFAVTIKKDLKSSELDQVLKDFFVHEGSDPNARLLLWFAGHGHTIDGEGYIVPADAPGPGPDKADAPFRRKAISLRRFGEYMREAKAKHVLAIFDSCFAGSIFNVARSLPPPAITFATIQPVRQFISSGEAEQLVSDDGTFRKLFLDALVGNESAADANRDGYITGTELGLFLHDKITNLTNNRQTPRYGKLNAYGLDRGDFVFRVTTPEVPAPSGPQLSKTKSGPGGTVVLLENDEPRRNFGSLAEKREQLLESIVRLEKEHAGLASSLQELNDAYRTEINAIRNKEIEIDAEKGRRRRVLQTELFKLQTNALTTVDRLEEVNVRFQDRSLALESEREKLKIIEVNLAELWARLKANPDVGETKKGPE